jgi:hypothetical protein
MNITCSREMSIQYFGYQFLGDQHGWMDLRDTGYEYLS